MLNEYGFVDGRFDTVATGNFLDAYLAAETLYDGAVAVAVNPESPSLALITPIAGMDASEDGHELERVNYVADQDDRKIAAVYREGDELSPGLVNDLVRLANRPVTHSIYVNAGLLFEAARMFESDQVIELCLVPSDAPPMSRVPSPWEALMIALAGGYPGNVAVVAPVSITNTGRHKADAPRSEPSSTRPLKNSETFATPLWNRLADCPPSDGCKCRVLAFDRSDDSSIAITVATWDEEHECWQGLDGAPSTTEFQVGGGYDVYWTAFDYLPNNTVALASFHWVRPSSSPLVMPDGAVVLPSEPNPIRPVAPWLDATDPNNDPGDGDAAWVAVKGRNEWTVALCLWDEGRSEWFLEDDDRYLFGFIDHRDVECYHCPSDSFATHADAVASLST